MKSFVEPTPKTRGEKLLIVLRLLIPVAVLGTSVYGLAIGDALGGLLLSFLPASVFAVIATVVSIAVEKSVTKLSRRIWIAVGIAALLAASMFANRSVPDALKGADTILAYVMLIHSFPVALLVPFLLMSIAPLWEGSGSLVSLSAMWFAFFVAGYLQWFVLLPWLWGKWKGRQARSAAPSA